MLKKKGVVLPSATCIQTLRSGCLTTSSFRHKKGDFLTRPRHERRQSHTVIAKGYSRHRHEKIPWPEVSSINAIPTPYQIFNQKKGSAYSKQRFYELVKIYHPDRHGLNDSPDDLSYHMKIERYRLVVAANDILSDPVRRAAYDRYGAGWNGSPGVDKTGQASSDMGTWSSFSGRGWGHGPDGPSQNATWEDWERWYQKEAGGKQEPTYFSNLTFVALIVLFAAIGGLGQATRAGNYSMSLLEQRDAIHHEMSRDLNRRRRESENCGNREERIQHFLKQRDPFGYGIADPKEQQYQKLFPNPETDSIEAIYGRNYNPQDLPAENLTHVLYAFANVRSESGEVYLTDPWSDSDKHYPSDSWNDVGTNLYGCLKQLNLLKRKHRHFNVLLSIGGWTYSSNFPAPASTPQGRATFASSAVSLLKDYGLDGLDIDWEYPKDASEAQHLVLLLKECREALDKYGESLPTKHRFELSVACPAGKQNYNKMNLRSMDKYLDFWNLMAYDYAGSWDSTSGHQANLFPSTGNPQSTPFSTEAAIEDYHGAGVPLHKVVLGMPLYGRAFENTEGLGKPFSGVGEGTWENGVHDFKRLPLPGADERYDEEAGATYSYDPQRKVLVTYDTVQMARRKAEYVCQKGLGGGMWWESSADHSDKRGLILNAVNVLRERNNGRIGGKTNCLEYPYSRFENVRKGFPGE